MRGSVSPAGMQDLMYRQLVRLLTRSRTVFPKFYLQLTLHQGTMRRAAKDRSRYDICSCD